MNRPVIVAVTLALCVGVSLSGLVASRARSSSMVTPRDPVEIAAAVPTATPVTVAAPMPSAEPRVPADGAATLASEPPAPETSPAPKHADWKDSSPVRFTRSDESRCKARRLREWIRIDCDIPGADSIALIAGSRDGVEIWTSELEGHGAVLIFPVRRGDRRVFQVNESAGKYGVSPAALVSEQWVDGEDRPLVTVQRA